MTMPAELPPMPASAREYYSACGRVGASARGRHTIVGQVCGAEAERLAFAKYCGHPSRARAKRRRQRGVA